MNELDSGTYQAVIEIHGRLEMLDNVLQFLMLERVMKEPRDQWQTLADRIELQIANRSMPHEMSSAEERKMYVGISEMLETATKAFASTLRENLAKAAKLVEDQSPQAPSAGSPKPS